MSPLLLLDLMSLCELEESIELLRSKLFHLAEIKGFSDIRTIEISQTLDLYLHRYFELEKKNNLKEII